MGRRPARTVYEITEEGRRELVIQRDAALEVVFGAADPLSVVLLFAAGADAAELGERLAARRRRVAGQLEAMAAERHRLTRKEILPPLAVAAFRRGELRLIVDPGAGLLPHRHLPHRTPPAEIGPPSPGVTGNTVGMDNLRYSESIVVIRSPEYLYDMISDVTRMGEWSPICKACWWDDGDGPRAGAWFTGRNELPERVWETRSQVVAADRGREFAFVVGGAWVRWGYTFTAAGEGTQVTESWEFLPAGGARFHQRFGDDAEAQIADRTAAAHQGIPITLAAIKRAAESG